MRGENSPGSSSYAVGVLSALRRVVLSTTQCRAVATFWSRKPSVGRSASSVTNRLPAPALCVFSSTTRLFVPSTSKSIR